MMCLLFEWRMCLRDSKSVVFCFPLLFLERLRSCSFEICYNFTIFFIKLFFSYYISLKL